MKNWYYASSPWHGAWHNKCTIAFPLPHPWLRWMSSFWNQDGIIHHKYPRICLQAQAHLSLYICTFSEPLGQGQVHPRCQQKLGKPRSVFWFRRRLLFFPPTIYAFLSDNVIFFSPLWLGAQNPMCPAKEWDCLILWGSLVAKEDPNILWCTLIILLRIGSKSARPPAGGTRKAFCLPLLSLRMYSCCWQKLPYIGMAYS